MALDLTFVHVGCAYGIGWGSIVWLRFSVGEWVDAYMDALNVSAGRIWSLCGVDDSLAASQLAARYSFAV